MERATGETDVNCWAEADAPEALQRYRTLVNSVDDGIYQLDREGRFVAVNDTIVEMTGYAREELLGEPVSLLLDEDDVERIGQEIRRRLSSDEPGADAIEFTVHTADGDEIDCELQLSLLVDGEASETPREGGETADSDFQGTVGVVRDVTDRNRAEQRLKEREQQLRRERDLTDRLLETSPVGIQVLDDEGEVTRMNGRIKELLDAYDDSYSPSDRTVYDENGDRVSVEEHPFSRTLETGEPVYDEILRVELPGGDRRWLSVNAAPIVDENGGIDRVVTTGEDVTDLKERERELRAHRDTLETELEEVYGRVTDAFYALDDRWRFTYVNERAAELLGVTEEELLGADLWETFPESTTADEVRESLRTAMEDQEATTFEVFSELLGFWIEARIYPSETGLSVYFNDITERKERERELELFRTLLDHSTDSVFVIDPDTGAILDSNDTACRSLGYSRAELLRLSVPDIDTELPTREAWQPFVADLRAEGETTFEGTHRRKDGTTFPVEIDISHVELDREYVLAISRDVTERRERKRAMEERKRELRTLIELLPVAVFVADDDGRILEWNEAAEEVWGGEVAESESIAEYDRYDGWWADTGEPVDPDEWALARAVRGEEVPDPDEIEIEGFDGERRTVLNHGMPIRDENGEVSRAVITLVDITERKEYQRQLEKTNERLERFAYAASHDLQEPLRMVSSYLQMIEHRYSDDLDEEGREFLEFAVDGAERMREMIDGLLEYSRVQTQANPFEPVELGDVLADVREDLQVKIEEHDATIVAEDLPRIEGDPSQIRQVLQNLLDNAIEYSGEGPPRIRVTAERDGAECVVAVRDNGIGIDPDEADRIFDVFERLHSRDEHSGTGIGLALCERVVERHGGEIWVESEPGDGTTFSFTLPVATDRDT
ncbi:multi-sensor signal transduction histidine kinase [Haloterrigena salina JCM 13891]|uniref:histidine kinase n=1 Tax=Haloterrigena salina JCM 13891 TaxID=1227488 RepID=M0BVK1_9EURY|nr:PAS domain S-box protein [Haloterrigena salina]ELZ14137.1 multi-sensor signal transduction histidine kinase [Haloterrigena salina JCM 13891]